MVSRKQLVHFLSGLHSQASFPDRIKIKYRPWICPFDRLITFAEDKKSVFDIGCGSGQFCALIREFTNVEKIKGIEISSRLIENARELNNHHPDRTMIFEVFDGKSLPEDIRDYQLIYMIDVLHHIPLKDHKVFFLELYSKMASGSEFVLKDIDGAHPFVVFNKLHDLIFSGEIGHELSCGRTMQLLRECGFEVKEQFNQRTLVYPHAFYICRKP